jgi:hypothetical protein
MTKGKVLAIGSSDTRIPTATDTRWETTTCFVWNERDQATAEEELTYEVAWIPELCMWRRFLLARRKVHG